VIERQVAGLVAAVLARVASRMKISRRVSLTRVAAAGSGAAGGSPQAHGTPAAASGSPDGRTRGLGLLAKDQAEGPGRLQTLSGFVTLIEDQDHAVHGRIVSEHGPAARTGCLDDPTSALARSAGPTMNETPVAGGLVHMLLPKAMLRSGDSVRLRDQMDGGVLDLGGPRGAVVRRAPRDHVLDLPPPVLGSCVSGVNWDCHYEPVAVEGWLVLLYEVVTDDTVPLWSQTRSGSYPSLAT